MPLACTQVHMDVITKEKKMFVFCRGSILLVNSDYSIWRLFPIHFAFYCCCRFFFLVPSKNNFSFADVSLDYSFDTWTKIWVNPFPKKVNVNWLFNEAMNHFKEVVLNRFFFHISILQWLQCLQCLQ